MSQEIFQSFVQDAHSKWIALLQQVEESETMASVVGELHKVLEQLGFPKPYPDAERVILSVSVMLFTLVFYFVFFGNRHRNRRKRLARELEKAQELVDSLAAQLEEIEESESLMRTKRGGKEIRVWMDGAFDVMHYGHMNAFRQGRALGTTLVVGVNSDESITRCKGTAPVMNDEERIGAVRGCKWVDEVVLDVPYVMTPEYLDKVIKEYNIDYVVHGDDPCIVDGKDVYADAKARGVYRSIPRTEGVSTTDIVGRMLYLTRDHHDKTRADSDIGSDAESSAELVSKTSTTNTGKKSPFVRRTKFLTTSRMLRIFSAGVKAPPKGAKIVYVDGAFDMFHIGHVEILKQAKAMGDYLIAGVYNDNTVNRHRGLNYPIMNLNERVLSVLGCAAVDDVLIDAPWEITQEMIKSLNISLVVVGTAGDTEVNVMKDTREDYKVPKDMGILRQIDSPSQLTVKEIVSRIKNNESVFAQKVEKKMIAENEYYDKRYDLNNAGKAEKK